uniref:SH3 domain-containing protein n=1 Tax=Acrobeloides nanus TaxID=290746 RepID=A0A914CMP1_9BILA
MVELNVNGKIKRIKPEEVSSQILIKLKKAAEDVAQQPIKNIVLTVPAYFDEHQKKATIKAAELAGLNVLELISEPSAAAYAYEYNKRQASNLNLLVFDFGGGTLDVVIVKVRNGKFDVVTIGGDTQLGGRDFDNVLMSYFMDIFVKKYKKNITRKDEKSVWAQQKLLKECIDLKHMLTSAEEANLYLGEIFPDIHENIEINRSTFNKICFSFFHRIEMVIEGTLKEAEMTPKDINEVILVGGSSRIPEIQEMLLKIFPIKELNKSLNPDEAIAYGATLRATQLINNTIPNIRFTEVNASRSKNLFAKLRHLDIGPTARNSNIPPVPRHQDSSSKISTVEEDDGFSQVQLRLAMLLSQAEAKSQAVVIKPELPEASKKNLVESRKREPSSVTTHTQNNKWTNGVSSNRIRKTPQTPTPIPPDPQPNPVSTSHPVYDVPAPKPASKPKLAVKPRGPTVRALYEYDAQDTDELSFDTGQIIELVRKNESGWWQGRIGPRNGLFPSNYVEEQPQVPTVRALYEYEAHDTDELSFDEGQIVELVKKDESGWWQGRIGSRTGLFPSNYVEEQR